MQGVTSIFNNRFKKRISWIALAVFIVGARSAFAEELGRAYRIARNEILKEDISGIEDKLAGMNLFESKMRTAGEWRLPLAECTQLVLKQNIRIKISYLDLDTTRRDIDKKKAVFDPNTTLSSEYAHERSPVNAGTSGAATDTLTHSLSVDKEFSTGGTVTLAGSVERSGASDHIHASDYSVSVSQPLLKNFWVDRKRVKISIVNYEIGVETLRNQIIDRISEAQTAYWEIVHAREVLVARKTAYRQALEILHVAQKGLKIGNRTKIDVLQAQASAASRKEDILQARKSLQDREDILKKILSGPVLSGWDERKIVTDPVEPDFKLEAANPQASLRQALQNRPDYLQALHQLETDQLDLSIAKNGLLPNVSVDYAFNLNGTGDSSRNAFDTAFGGRFPGNTVGLTFTMPWFDRAESAEYHQKKNDFQSQKLRIKDLALTIVKEVRERVRQVHTTIERVRVAKRAYQLQEQKLEAEQKRYEIGVATSFEVLTFQQDVANSRVARIRAIADYYEALIQLWQTLGITLEKNGIVFDKAAS